MNLYNYSSCTVENIHRSYANDGAYKRKCRDFTVRLSWSSVNLASREKGVQRLKVTGRARRRFRGFKGFREKAPLKGLHCYRTSINVQGFVVEEVSTDLSTDFCWRLSSSKLTRTRKSSNTN